MFLQMLNKLTSNGGQKLGSSGGGGSSSSSSSGGLSTSNGGLTRNSNGSYTVNNTRSASSSGGYSGRGSAGMSTYNQDRAAYSRSQGGSSGNSTYNAPTGSQAKAQSGSPGATYASGSSSNSKANTPAPAASSGTNHPIYGAPPEQSSNRTTAREARGSAEDRRSMNDPGARPGLLSDNNQLAVDLGNTGGYNQFTAPYVYDQLLNTPTPAGLSKEDAAAFEQSKKDTMGYLTLRTLQNSTADDPVARAAETNWTDNNQDAAVIQAGKNIDALNGPRINGWARNDEAFAGPPVTPKVRHAGNTTYAAEADNGLGGLLASGAGFFLPGVGLAVNGTINANQGEEFNDVIFNQPMTGAEKFKVGAESALTNAIPGLDAMRNKDPNAFYADYGKPTQGVLSQYDSADAYIAGAGIDPNSDEAKSVQENWDYWKGYDSHLKNFKGTGERVKTFREDSYWNRPFRPFNR